MTAARSDLASRLRALGEAVELCQGRCPDDLVGAARSVVVRAGQRVAFSGGSTVVALAGATGSGKSSLFNAITASQLARVAVTRPTTADAMAAAWANQVPAGLLDWLEVPRRHLITSGPARFSDLVLLDLPDHDSTETSHRLTVDRLVHLVDSLVWVVDPQKYADAALHDRYLRPLSPYAEVMMVVLNQADRLAPHDLARCQADLRRLLDSEGLAAAPILTVSAITGAGIADLRDALAGLVAAKQAMTRRLSTDIDVAAASLADELGAAEIRRPNRALVEDVERASAEAAGVPLVSDAVGESWRRRGSAATGWPFVSWLSRLRPDPLRRLRLAVPEVDPSPTAISRTSIPPANAVQRARLDGALRALTEATSDGLPRGWAQVLRTQTRGDHQRLLERLDAALSGAELRLGGSSAWWSFVTLVQWLLIGAVLIGAGWLATGPLLAWLQLPPLPEVSWYQIPASTWLVGGGVLAGLVLAGLGRLLVEWGARAKARTAAKGLRAVVAQVVADDIIAPMEAELDRYRGARSALARARG